ncbi:MAG: hypothetical protein MI919_14555 [Holophagales bacterium]|nr:hypothetical protein [Holophagales bacterium]
MLDLGASLSAFVFFAAVKSYPWNLAMLAGAGIGVLLFAARRTLRESADLYRPAEPVSPAPPLSGEIPEGGSSEQPATPDPPFTLDLPSAPGPLSAPSPQSGPDAPLPSEPSRQGKTASAARSSR